MKYLCLFFTVVLMGCVKEEVSLNSSDPAVEALRSALSESFVSLKSTNVDKLMSVVVSSLSEVELKQLVSNGTLKEILNEEALGAVKDLVDYESKTLSNKRALPCYEKFVEEVGAPCTTTGWRDYLDCVLGQTANAVINYCQCLQDTYGRDCE